MILQLTSSINIFFSSRATTTTTVAAAAAAAATLLSPIRSLPLSSIFPNRHSLTSFCCSATITGTERLLQQNIHFQTEEEEEDGNDGGDITLHDDQDEVLKIKELDELPEQWRRSKVAWLCKELPSHKHSTLTRLLNAQRKWITQDDLSYVVVHCLRIRENEAAFRVYKWMVRQHWFRFDFALATKLADCLGKDHKYSKCREVFDEIIARGRVPSESTFHTLVVAYISAPVDGCLEEACGVYNRMIQFGGYRPKLSLHNSLFRAIVSKPGVSSKQFLNQAEFIFHNLLTSKLQICKEVYTGLIWLHSYQDVIDKDKINFLREEMRVARFDETKDVLVSIMRASSKLGDLDEAERTWKILAELDSEIPSQAFVYHMELYAKVGQPMTALDIFKGMNELGVSPNVVAYQKIIEVMTKAQEIELAELLMTQFIESGLKHLTPSFIALMDMYLTLDMHHRLEETYSTCSSKCCLNQTICILYLDSLVRIGNLEMAEKIFSEMHKNGTIGTNARSCNIILGGFLASEDYVKAEKVFEMMRQKKYDIEPTHLEKLEYVLSGLKKKVVKKPVTLKLDQEQREILIGLLLGGVRIESDVEGGSDAIYFDFNRNSSVHSLLKVHIHERFYEWLRSHSSQTDEGEVPYQFSTVKHLSFAFFADQFWLNGKLRVPRLIHRWLSPRALAYWYMYTGLRTSSSDVLLKLRTVNREAIERVVKCFLMRSLDCRVKQKGGSFWIGFQGSNAEKFWQLIEPYLLHGIKELPEPTLGNLQNGNEHQFDV